MRKIFISVGIMTCLSFISCSNEKSGINNASGGSTTNTDSSTTNPVNSEYGTPNASENPTDSAQSVSQESANK